MLHQADLQPRRDHHRLCRCIGSPVRLPNIACTSDASSVSLGAPCDSMMADCAGIAQSAFFRKPRRRPLWLTVSAGALFLQSCWYIEAEGWFRRAASS